MSSQRRVTQVAEDGGLIVRVEEFRPVAEYRYRAGELELRYTTEYGWSNWHRTSSVPPEVLPLLGASLSTQDHTKGDEE